MSAALDAALPTPGTVARLGQQRDRIEEAWASSFILHLPQHQLPYETQPYLFLDAFPDLATHSLEQLALGLRFLVSSVIVTDNLMDRAPASSTIASDLLQVQAMQFEYYHLLYDLFPPAVGFWDRFRTYLIEFTDACLEEKRFIRGERAWGAFTEERALEIAAGKTGLARLTGAALVELAGDDRHDRAIEQSIRKHYIAWQLWDDLCDWKDGVRHGVPSLLLTRVLEEAPAAEDREELIPQLARKIYYGGHANYLIDRALALLDEAEGHVADIAQLPWAEVIDKLRSQFLGLRRDLDRIVQKNLVRARGQRHVQVSLPPARETREELAWSALSFLLHQWHLGFGEARHIMYLPKAEGYSGPSEFPSGDVFQRALISDALCDADPLLDGELRPVIDYETRYLLSCRSQEGSGGWRYLPAVPELAPDADDLAQVMQVLLRADHRAAVEKYCEKPLRLLLRDAMREDGGFETWIIPRTGRSPLEETQATLSIQRWGTGPDAEVVANLLYALHLYDRSRFSAVLERGLSFLEAGQTADGSWTSTWYHGSFYGTYVCLRLLAAARPESPAIARGRAYLLREQRASGGWGYREDDDPLSTALALLGLCEAEPPGTDLPGWARRGLDCLAGAREADGGWAGIPFISCPSYGSRTITATYVLKASLACRPRDAPTAREAERQWPKKPSRQGQDQR